MTQTYRQIITAAGLALALDLLTKAWAERALELYRPVPLLADSIRLTLNHNTGVAFGLGDGGTLWPTILSGGVIAGAAIWLVLALRRDALPARLSWPIGLILGGGLGNFLDRLPDRRVTDFLDLGMGATRWPTFNLADVCITAGVALVLLLSLKEPASLERPAEV